MIEPSTGTRDGKNGIIPREEVTLADYWGVIWKRRLVILGVLLITLFCTGLVKSLMTPVYQARTTLLPIEASQGRFASALGSLQNIPLVGGAIGGAMGRGGIDKLVSILSSRTIAEEVIQQLDLIKDIFPDAWDGGKNQWKTKTPPTVTDAAEVLQKKWVRATDDRKGLITLTVDHRDPKIAVLIANEYTAALQRFLNINAISLAKRNRLFLEKQLENNRTYLQGAEEELRAYQTTKKIVSMNAQAEGAIKALADLKAQIIGREVQLGVLKEMATPANPDVQRMENEIRELQRQLSRLEAQDGRNGKNHGSNGVFPSLTEAPAIGLQFARLKRDTLVQEKVFELLTQQVEMAKIEEAKDDITFQVIDAAVTPKKPIKPKKMLNLLMAGTVSLFLAVFLAFLLEYLGKTRLSTSGGLSPRMTLCRGESSGPAPAPEGHRS